jgi:predicted AlkP superfamily pyrophosphatase or phosphodiesterase
LFAALLVGATPAARTAAEPPSLVVLLAVDQMRADYVERYGRHWTAGLRRLLDGGARFDHAAYPFLNTVTCTGHSTIGTGRFPRRHGMILNQWWDRGAGRWVACTEDPSVQTVHAGGTIAGGDSAARMMAPAFAARLRANGGRVVGLSLKARSAITLAGADADAVVWFGGPGTWVTSTAYARELPPFVLEVLKRHPIEADRRETWTKRLEASAYVGEDAAAGERPPAGWSNVFPHPLESSSAEQFLERWQVAPISDSRLVDLALAALDRYELGRRGRTDFLAVSFSSLDRVGHAFGPDSHEVQDVLARVDAEIGRLLDQLDARVGRGRYVVALSADHGVGPVPEQAAAKGLDAGRLDPKRVIEAINTAAAKYLGPATGSYVAAVAYTDIYLRPGVWERLRANAEAAGAVVEAIGQLPGIMRVFRSDELAQLRDDDPIQRAAALSYFPGRSGDLIVVPKRYWMLSPGAAATHGTLHDYDQQVPVVFAGAGIRPGRYTTAATPADIAPTLAALLQIQGDFDGRPLREALADAATGAGAHAGEASRRVPPR